MIKKQGTVVASVIGIVFLFLLIQNPGPLFTSQEDLHARPSLTKYRTNREDVLRHNNNGFNRKRPLSQGAGVVSQKERKKNRRNPKEAVYARRRRRVVNICNKTTENLIPARDIYTYRKLVFVSKYKLMWCPVLKAASTTWMDHLMYLFNVPHSPRKSFRQLLRNQEHGNERKLLKEYFTFMVVRHPLDRLLSTYRDNILNADTPIYLDIRKLIIEEYREDNSTNSTTPTFNEFLMKVLDDMRRHRKSQAKNEEYAINQHWEPYWYSCSPCQIKYDVIAKTETMDVDQKYIIHELGLQDKLNSIHSRRTTSDGYRSTSEAVSHYYSQVPMSLLRKVVKEYQADFDLFDYSPTEYFALTKRNR